MLTSPSRRLVLATFGSAGDVFPYLAIAVELKKRGHQVTVATSEIFRERVEREGLGFHAVRPDVRFDDRELIAYVMDSKRGGERLIRYLASVIRESYEDFLAAGESADAMVTHPATPGAVFAVQKLGLPWISSVLAPFSFFSAYDPPVMAPAPWLYRLERGRPGLARFLFRYVERISAGWLEPVFDLRRELGIPDRGHPFFGGQHAPGLVLALFSRQMAAPQADWPANTVVTGFPFFDRGELPPELARFLEDGPAPVVFTLGSSAVGAARDFYIESLRAVQGMGVRAVFLTGPHPQGLPDVMPGGTLAVEYAPHGPAFERAAAVVHQGGIGTTAQALRAGHPMLVVPFSHDQYDNAERARRLGVAEVLPQSKFSAARAEPVLRKLLSEARYVQSAVRVSEGIRKENGGAAAADAIEAMLFRRK